MSASLAFQKMARAILAADAAVTALVPAQNIVDANARPEIFPQYSGDTHSSFPRINLGEDQELPGDDVVRRYTRLFSTLHIWNREPGLAGAKAIAGVVRRALEGQRWAHDNVKCLDTAFSQARFIRDPDGETAHAIATFEATLESLS
jgi:hypothetical protein